jgi:hypothetical protein
MATKKPRTPGSPSRRWENGFAPDPRLKSGCHSDGLVFLPTPECLTSFQDSLFAHTCFGEKNAAAKKSYFHAVGWQYQPISPSVQIAKFVNPRPHGLGSSHTPSIANGRFGHRDVQPIAGSGTSRKMDMTSQRVKRPLLTLSGHCGQRLSAGRYSREEKPPSQVHGG